VIPDATPWELFFNTGWESLAGEIVQTWSDLSVLTQKKEGGEHLFSAFLRVSSGDSSRSHGSQSQEFTMAFFPEGRHLLAKPTD
jgi:hypothetical protein